MAEYKYRALGWQDDDIASLNVVDGTTADNQVELQITKQGAGGTIDGPAIIGKDGITINKAANSEEIEISGSGLLQKDTRNTGVRRAYTVNEDGTKQEKMNINVDAHIYSLVRRDENASVHGLVPDSPTDTVLLNKKYVDDNYVKKDTSMAAVQVYGHNAKGNPQMFYISTPNANPNWLCMYQPATLGAKEPTDSGRLITQDPTQPYQAANKHYVDNAVTNAVIGDLVFKTLFSNHQSIVGQGNIDLYKHHVAITVNYIGADYVFYTDIYSSMNFAIDSLTNLKTYLGNDFVQGFYGANEVVITSDLTRYAIQGTLTPTTFYWPVDSKNSYHLEVTPISNITFTDTVTTIEHTTKAGRITSPF